MPKGCSVESAGDWAAHYNRHVDPLPSEENKEKYTTVTAELAGQTVRPTRTLLPVHGPYRIKDSPHITRVISHLTDHTHLHVQYDFYDQAPASLSLADVCVVVVEGVLHTGSMRESLNFDFVSVDDDGDLSAVKPSPTAYRDY